MKELQADYLQGYFLENPVKKEVYGRVCLQSA